MPATFELYLKAAYPAVWVNTSEPERVQRDLLKVAVKVQEENARLAKASLPINYRWDLLTGLAPLEQISDARGYQLGKALPGTNGPVPAIKTAVESAGGVTFLWNFHKFIGSPEVIQAVQNAINLLKETGACLVILAPDQEKLPVELSRLVVTLDYPLPTRDEMSKLIAESIAGFRLKRVPDYDKDLLLDAALGLTESEAEDAIALSYKEANGFSPTIVAREKAGALLRQAKVSIANYPNRFEQIGGLETLKKFCLQTARSAKSRGVIIVGVSGGGKSTFAKALGNELGIPTLILDISKMMQGLVGSSESNMREALKAIDAMGRVVVFMDEIEKGLAGVGNSGNLDSGVKAGVGGTLLKWMSDRETGKAYVVATANNVKTFESNPEYLRAGRFDGMFYVDLPTRLEKDLIWSIHSKAYLGVDSGAKHPEDDEWTGAEIESCCSKAAMMSCSLEEAKEFVVPIAKSMSTQIQEMRAWAEGRCIPASIRESKATGKARYRKIGE